METWTEVTLESPDIPLAKEIAERYRLTFWDGLVLAAAEKEEAAGDLSHGQKYGKATVLNPFLS